MPTASAEQNMKQNVVVCQWRMCKWISQDGCFCSIDLFGRIDSSDICKEMGVLLGRLWQIIPLTDQLPGSKESGFAGIGWWQQGALCIPGYYEVPLVCNGSCAN